MTFKLKATDFQRNIMELEEDPGAASSGLPRTVTLICTPSGATAAAQLGTYKVKITDETPASDTPWTTAPSPRAYIEFTLYVVGDSVSVTGITAPDDDKSYPR